MAEMMQADSEERDRKSQEVIDAGDVEEETPENLIEPDGEGNKTYKVAANVHPGKSSDYVFVESEHLF